MQLLKCDSKGRVYLKEKLRRSYGERFVLMKTPDELVLIPAPVDPLKDLQAMGEKLKEKSIGQIKKEIRKRALRDIATS